MVSWAINLSILHTPFSSNLGYCPAPTIRLTRPGCQYLLLASLSDCIRESFDLFNWWLGICLVICGKTIALTAMTSFWSRRRDDNRRTSRHTSCWWPNDSLNCDVGLAHWSFNPIYCAACDQRSLRSLVNQGYASICDDDDRTRHNVQSSDNRDSDVPMICSTLDGFSQTFFFLVQSYSKTVHNFSAMHVVRPWYGAHCSNAQSVLHQNSSIFAYFGSIVVAPISMSLANPIGHSRVIAGRSSSRSMEHDT